MRVTFERSGENSIINKQGKIMYNDEQCSKPTIFLPSSNFKAENRLLFLLPKMEHRSQTAQP